MFPVIPSKAMIEYAETMENLAMLETVHTGFVEIVVFISHDWPVDHIRPSYR